MIPKSIVTALNTSAYVAVKLRRDNNQNQRSVAVFTDDQTSYYMAWSSSGDGVTTIPDGLPLAFDTADVDPDGTIFWAKASAGTPNLVCLVGGIR